MKVIINQQTKKRESEAEFKNRFKNSVSFGPELTEDIVTLLDKDCTLCNVGKQPNYDPTFQMCFLREPFLHEGKYISTWLVANITEGDLNAYYNKGIEAFIDAQANVYHYTSQDRMISYIGDSNPTTDREARFMKHWRGQVWNVALVEIKAIMDKMKSGEIKIPDTVEFIIAKFPPFKIPSDF